LLKQNTDKNGFLLFLFFLERFYGNKKLSLSPDSSGILFLNPVRVLNPDWVGKDRANSGTTVDKKPDVSAPEKSKIYF
jgi:hypothetical protein